MALPFFAPSGTLVGTGWPNAPVLPLLVVGATDARHVTKLGTQVYGFRPMIAPMLPGAESLAEILAGKVDNVILDRMNYHHADWVYRKYGLEEKMTDEFFAQTEQALSASFAKLGINLKL